jgi:hypothetical protein
MDEGARTVCWKPIWHPRVPDAGLEHCRVAPGRADAVVLAFDDDGSPFRLAYALDWDRDWRLRSASLRVLRDGGERTLALATDGAGAWRDSAGRALPALDGCLDIDVWPTPFTNTFPIRREPFAPGERRVFRMAWVSAPALTVRPMQQAYTRLADGRWRYESLDGSGFAADLRVDADGLVVDYPGVFARVPPTPP